jgi:dihydroorotase/N-acyl-D-amino-acid deacylase
VLLLAFFLLAANPYDVVIQHGRIIDGTGSPWYSGDIGIRQGRIAAIGNLTGAPARRTIDVHGMVVAPGFIDMLGQSELTILVNPHLPSKIYQGITTEITGEGSSAAPVNDDMLKADRVGYEHYGITPGWRTFRDYFARLQQQGMGINLASYVGATQVRRMVLGDADRAPDAAELERMRALVREAMRDGAVGVSSALQYAPAPYATTEELIALAAEAAKSGGIYATHMRSEGDAIVPAIDEAIRSRQSQLGPHARSDRAYSTSARCGRGYHGGHLRVPCRVQHVFGDHPALGARRRRCEADRAPEGSSHTRAYS